MVNVCYNWNHNEWSKEIEKPYEFGWFFGILEKGAEKHHHIGKGNGIEWVGKNDIVECEAWFFKFLLLEH